MGCFFLAFFGFLQARWFGQILKGRCSLPSAREMERTIDKDAAKVKERFSASPRHTIQVRAFKSARDAPARIHV